MKSSKISEEKIRLLATALNDATMVNMACSDEEIDNDIILVPENNSGQSKRYRISEHRKHNNLHHGICRYSRFILFLVVVPILFLYILLYKPTNAHVPKRYAMLTDWPYSASRNVADYVFPSEETTLVAPTDMCQDKVFVIIMIFSDLQNFMQRQIIRETWANTTEFNYDAFQKLHAHRNGQYLKPTKKRLHYYNEFLSSTNPNNTILTNIKVRIVFFMGRSKSESLMGNETLMRLYNEAEQYNDIIQEDFIDTYNNLTIKSVLALKYLTKNCLNQSAYFMKCDDDTFVNVPNLLHYLLGGTLPLYKDSLEFFNRYTSQVMSPRNRLNDTKGLLIGHNFYAVEPISDENSKWYMPSYMYPGKTYPTYLSGSGYIMSMDVVSRLYNVALNTSLVYLEDVYLTGICRQAAHIKPRHLDLFSFGYSKHWCAFKGTITQHKLKGEHMLEAWKFVSNYSYQCPPPKSAK